MPKLPAVNVSALWSRRSPVVLGLAVAACVMVAGFGLPAGAGAEPLCTDTWTGGAAGKWQEAGNWSAAHTPTSSDVACIASETTVSVTSEGNTAGVLKDEGTLIIHEGSLEVATALEPSHVKKLTMEFGSTLSGTATVEITETLTWNTGTMSGTGSTVVQSGATATLAGPTGTPKLKVRTFVNHGTATLEGTTTGGARLAMYEGAKFENPGTFNENNQGIFGINDEEVGAATTFINTGTFQTTKNEQQARVEINFENKGTVNGKVGAIAFRNSSHTVTLANSSVLEGEVQFNGPAVSAGKFTAPSGSVTLESSTMTIPSGTKVAIATFVVKFEGIVTGEGTLAISKALKWKNESKMTGKGKTVLEAGATSEIASGAGIAHIWERKLVNEGSLTLKESSALGQKLGSVVENSGTFIANSEREFEAPSLRLEGTGVEVTGSFINTGIFKKTESVESFHLTVIETPFENNGGVHAEVGELKFVNPLNGIGAAERYGLLNPGAPGLECPVCGRPVNVATGNLVETQTDLSEGGRGPGQAFTRTYNSKAAAELVKGDFGYGWSTPFSDHVTAEVESKRVTLHQANGSTAVFAEAGGESFSAPAWSQAKLTGSKATSYTLTYPDQTKLVFAGATGRLETETDRNGNEVKVAYFGSGKIEAVSLPNGIGYKYHDNAEGLVDELTASGTTQTVKYSYEAGNLATVTEPGEVGARWSCKYDASHQLTEMTDGRAGKTKNEYTANKVVKQTDPAGRVLEFAYKGLETKITNSTTGAVTDMSFSGGGEPTEVIRGFGTSSATTERRQFNAAGLLTRSTDGNSHATTYGYDSEGNRTSLVDPNKHETKWGYSATHDVTSVTTPKGEVTTIKRDVHGNAEVIERPAPAEKTQTTKYKYTAKGDLESVEDPLKRVWKYEYEAGGERKAEIDPVGDKRTWAYSTSGFETSTVSPRGNVEGGEPAKYTTKIERDEQNRPIKVTDPLAHTTKYVYDGNGNLKELTDANSHTTTYTYNADDEPTKVKEPSGLTTETEYDGEGHVTRQTDGKAHVTKYKRNILGQITEVEDPLKHKTTKEYDAAGNLTKLTDPAKRTTAYSYDPANRLTEVSYSDGVTHSAKYEYDEDGDRTKMEDATGTSKYTYDQLDRLTETKDGHGDVAKYDYDLANQQTKITYPNAKAVTRTFDNAGRLEKVTDWLEHTISFGYDAGSNQTTATFPSNEDKYTLDEADQLTKTEMKKGAETLASLTYTRENNGALKTTSQTGLPGVAETKYTYDENNRLTKAATLGYAYDTADNPTKTGSSTNTFNEGNELEKGTGATYVYDEQGARTRRTPTTGPATTYGYDQAGNLTKVERPKEGETTEIKDSYAYDGDGLRASQTVGEATTYMTWSHSASLPLILNDGTNSYVYGPGGLPVEQINGTGTVLYVHHDQQGSTRVLTSSTGKREGAFTYDAYGTPAGHTGTAITPLGYDAQYTSADTGLVYLRARVFDPATAQFLTRDSIAPTTREPYVFAVDFPTAFGDPTGLLAIPLIGDLASGADAACGVTFEVPGLDAVTCGAAAAGSAYLAGRAIIGIAQSFANEGASAGEEVEEPAPGAQCPLPPRRRLPREGIPNSTDVLDRGNGSGQIRDYGPDGLPTKDLDFGHDHGAGDPHAHDWLGGVRQPGRPIGPNE